LNQKLRLLIRLFDSPVILILIFATILSILLGETLDGLIILAIIIPSGLLGYWQENRADKTMQDLLRRVEVKTKILRNGSQLLVSSKDIQVHDELILDSGVIIGGDAQITNSNSLLIDESLLTGESFSVEKRPGDLLQAGTYVISGSGRALVTKIGEQTQLGEIESSLSEKDTTTVFEKGSLAFGMLLLKTMSVLVVLVLVLNLVLHRPFFDSILFSLALAVGLTPQLLPVIISASLSTGARAMARKSVLVKRLDSIEDFGSVDVLCTDKTGTLTTGTIELISTLDAKGLPSDDVFNLAYLNAKLQEGTLNPIDLAIVSHEGAQRELATKIAEIPYDFDRRCVSVVIRNSETTIVTKGAFKNIIGICSTANVSGTSVPLENVINDLNKNFESLSSQGMRVLALATKKVIPQSAYTVADESDMQLQGLLAFSDPLKESAIDSIKKVRDLNIDIYLITGDNPLAAAAAAHSAGITSDEVLSGSDMEKLTDNQLSHALLSVRVLAEVKPLQKERVVKLLRASGKSVAYFGDGINDAPAIKASDVGISVDTAVDVAKSAASVVLLEKDLSVLADGIALGRRTFVNTMKYVRVGVSAAFGNVLSMAIATSFLPYLPMLPMQILLLNFLTDFPAISIAGDRVDPEVLKKPYAWQISNIKKFMILFGLVSTVFDLATFALLRLVFDASEKLFHTVWFVESSFTELVVMIILRTHRPFWRSKPGNGLLASTIIIAGIIVLLPFTGLGRLIGFVAIPSNILLALVGLTLIYATCNELLKRLWWKQ
jgi:Mg2+-importing ATPase